MGSTPDQEPDKERLPVPGCPDVPQEVRKQDHAGIENQEDAQVRRQRQLKSEGLDDFYDDRILGEVDGKRAPAGRPQGAGPARAGM